MSEVKMNRAAAILVVDDEPRMVELLRSVLTRDGYQMLSACCGRDALDSALKNVPDLILMDISMPDWDGYETTMHMKKHEKLRDIPVIFLSGRSEEEDGGRSLAIGGAMFLRKPFTVNQIRDVIGLALRTRPKPVRTATSC